MRKYLVAAGLACALAATYSLPTFAADSTAPGGANPANPTANPSTSAIQLDQMDANNPFGEIKIEQGVSPSTVYAGLSVDQRSDLAARCNLIVGNPNKFKADVPTWCKGYLDWQTANHPNND
jgi:hypothetical protein